MPEQDLIPIADAAKILKVSTQTVRRMIRNRELPAYKRVGIKSLLVPRDKVIELSKPRPVEIKPKRARR